MKKRIGGRTAGPNEAVQTLLDAADSWRKFIRQGDNMLEAAQDVADQALRIQQAPDLRSSQANLPTKVKQVEKTTNSAYKDFKDGREALYAFAKSLKISTRRKSAGKKSPDLGKMDDAKLGESLQKQSDLLGKSLRQMLESGAAISRKLREAAKDLSMGKEVDANALVSEALDFRDHVSNSVFAGMNSILRRAKAIDQRAKEAAMFASADRRSVAKTLRIAAALLVRG